MKQKLNSSGKVLTIFLVIIAVLLISLTAISIFFFQKEIERRKIAESIAEQHQLNETKLEGELQEVKKQNFLLEEKNKEADERINSLLDELELEEGLREELKKEAQALTEQLEEEKQAKATLREQVSSELMEAQSKVKQLEDDLTVAKAKNQELEDVSAKLASKAARLEQQLVEGIQPSPTPPPQKPVEVVKEEDKPEPTIMVSDETSNPISALPDGVSQGRILSVDVETEFVIVNLGEKDGVQNGQIMSVFRGKNYLGDIKITRLQPEMAAADLIPPFSSRTVRKNDQVVIKKYLN